MLGNRQREVKIACGPVEPIPPRDVKDEALGHPLGLRRQVTLVEHRGVGNQLGVIGFDRYLNFSRWNFAAVGGRDSGDLDTLPVVDLAVTIARGACRSFPS